MAHETRVWHENFLKYMNMIVNHKNYDGLAIEKKDDGSYSWIAPAMSEIGKKRIEWCINKAKELGLPIEAGVYADVMLKIHPTKKKVCQTCGKEMSLYYHYPNANFINSLNKKFGKIYTSCDHISNIWDDLLKSGFERTNIAEFLINKAGLNFDPQKATKEEIIDAIEVLCRKQGEKMLGPGAMSNFPDRYDGFHTYNRCCRSTQDKGRSRENLKSYTKDRRAYEYWSDGNIHAANQFMGSPYFNGFSADHVGPISLGFVHDPRYLRRMSSSDNSTKRDRLQLVDIQEIIRTERDTGIYPMSWYSKLIWEYIKENYAKNIDKIPSLYRDALKQNVANFMYILKIIIEKCNERGKDFLSKSFLENNFAQFQYSYSFDDKGNIIEKNNRHFTGRNLDECERYKRIAFESVFDYGKKENRNMKNNLQADEIRELNNICNMINKSKQFTDCKRMIVNLIESIERRIILGLV